MIYIPFCNKKIILKKERFNESHMGSKRTRTNFIRILLKKDCHDKIFQYHLLFCILCSVTSLGGFLTKRSQCTEERGNGLGEPCSSFTGQARRDQCGWAVLSRSSSIMSDFLGGSYLNRNDLRPLWNPRDFTVNVSHPHPVALGRIYGKWIGGIHLSSAA